MQLSYASFAAMFLALVIHLSAQLAAMEAGHAIEQAVIVNQPRSTPIVTPDEAYYFRFQPPQDSGVVNVRDYGAQGDGVTDDTAAIQQAIRKNINRNRYRASPFIYFPDGTYVVSDTIDNRVPNRKGELSWMAGCVLIGESRTGTVIKLSDQAAQYDNAQAPRAILMFGSENRHRRKWGNRGGGNQAFRHGLINMTVDTGANNPGAIGVDFLVSNRGTIDNVTVRAPASSGHTGIAMTRPWPGPGMIIDTRIEGFATGISMGHRQYGMTFENIEMIDQRKAAITNWGNVMAMRRVHYRGSAPFYLAQNQSQAMLSLLDSHIEGVDVATDTAALINKGIVNLRRVQFQGFAAIVRDLRKQAEHIPGVPDEATLIEHHDIGPQHHSADEPMKGLNLPIEDIPVVRPPIGTTWVDGGTSGESLQQAIDSGAEYIYIRPVRKIKLEQPLVLRGKVKLIWGFQGFIEATEGQVAIRVEDGESDIIQLEHLYISGPIEHHSTRTFVFRHGDRGGLNNSTSPYKAMSSGKTHHIDIIGRLYDIGPGHQFWGRQLNAEFMNDYLFTNSGGNAWVLGFKMESSSASEDANKTGTPMLLNRNGGSTEIFSGFLYTLGHKKEAAPRVPAFTNLSGRVALSYRENGHGHGRYRLLLKTPDEADNVPKAKLKGAGAALLTDERD